MPSYIGATLEKAAYIGVGPNSENHLKNERKISYKGTFAFIAWIEKIGGPSIASLLGISSVVYVVWASLTGVTAFITNIGGSLFWKSKRVVTQTGQGMEGSQRGRLLMGLVYLGLANLIVSPFRFFGLLSALSLSPPARQSALIAWSIAVWFLFMSVPMLLVYLLPWNILVDFSD